MRANEAEQVFEDDIEMRATGTDSASPLQQFASERLAAHRNRRPRANATETVVGQPERMAGGEAARSVQEAVAKRYENSVSYREFLAAEAERALHQAQAEAEVAARNARAVAEEQMKLLDELERWRQTEQSQSETALAEQKAEQRGELADAMADIAVAAARMMPPSPRAVVESARAAHADPGLTVRLYEELGAGLPDVEAVRVVKGVFAEVGDQHALDEEIAFRQAPNFIEFLLEPVAIPANVIEFPRQIVAARKARPRRAEGPLLEESKPAPQLRIFEVDAEQISAAPAETPSAPEWQSMFLEAQTVAESMAPLDAQMHFGQTPQTAALGLRMMSTAVDAACVGVAFAGFVALALKVAGGSLQTMPRPWAAGCAAVVFLLLGIAYQMLFFSLSDATPGMRYARIALCTFGEAYPTRAAMRRRVVATLLAACPLGLGLAWAWMDEDRLGWHDRMSRMYPRAY